MNFFKNFIKYYGNFLCILVLLLFCYLILFLNLGNYRLIDTDETRYINIARVMFANGDFITPVLNFEPFLEKPPLFYWLTILSYKLTGSVDEFSSRLPVALMSTFMILSTYFFGKKALNSKIYGLISALILLTSVWIVLFSHIAILDMGFCALVTVSIYCSIITLFNIKEKNKKYFWYLFYFFMALSVLQKGLIGIILPFSVTLLTFIALNKAKELIKPVYIIPGIIIFLLTALPWHILVYKANGNVWINDYIIRHHFARFLNSSMGINRKRGFLFYIPVLLIGFLPWVFSLVGGVFSSVKSILKKNILKEALQSKTDDGKMLIFALIYAFFIFLFFSISSTKLPTYILPALPAFALITGYYWKGYLKDGKYNKTIKISSIVCSTTFIIAGILGLLYVYFLPADIRLYTIGAENFRIFTSLFFIIVPVFCILCIIFNKKLLIFAMNIILITGLSIIASTNIYNFISSFGQTELENYAKKANLIQNAKLVSFGFTRKYSILNYFKGKVEYIRETDALAFNELQEIIKQAKKKNAPVYLIIKKNIDYPPEAFEGFKKIESGKKYDLYLN